MQQEELGTALKNPLSMSRYRSWQPLRYPSLLVPRAPATSDAPSTATPRPMGTAHPPVSGIDWGGIAAIIAAIDASVMVAV